MSSGRLPSGSSYGTLIGRLPLGVTARTEVHTSVAWAKPEPILVPRAYDPFGLWLGSRALAGPDILSMRRVFVSHCQPIRFAGFDGKSVIHGLPVLDQTRARPELSIPTTGQKDRRLWGRE